MNTNGFPGFIQFLNELEQKKISYTLAHNREDAIMVIVAAPGERWEIEFLSDGSIEIEKFISTGEITGAESLGELFARYEDQDETMNSPEETTLATRVGKIA
jgi:hypothetical protein